MEGVIGRNQAAALLLPRCRPIRLPSSSTSRVQRFFTGLRPGPLPPLSPVRASPFDSHTRQYVLLPARRSERALPALRTSRAVINPLPGVWEVTVEARRTSDAAQTPFSLIGLHPRRHACRPTRTSSRQRQRSALQWPAQVHAHQPVRRRSPAAPPPPPHRHPRAVAEAPRARRGPGAVSRARLTGRRRGRS